MRTIPKISNPFQLLQEKQRLDQRRVELEKAIHYDWRDLKDSLQPKNIAKQVISKSFNRKEHGKENDIMTGSISLLVAKFTRKMFEKAGVKIDEWLKK